MPVAQHIMQAAHRHLLRLAALLAPLAIVILALSAPAAADQLSGRALVDALRQGGHNIYFRHAQTDWSGSDQVARDGDWTTCDASRMRQLSPTGRETARRVGDALRALEIPVGEVLSSEYCRAAQTARLLDLGRVETTRDVMNLRAAEYVGGRAEAVARAQAVLSRPPPAGTNRVVVGHGNLARAATGAYPGEAGSAVFRPLPDGKPGFELVAMLTPQDWARLVKEFAPAP